MGENSVIIAHGDLSENKKYNQYDKNTDHVKLSHNFYKLGTKYFDVVQSTKHVPQWDEVTLANIAFSCELFLKAILYGYKIDFNNSHNLNNLFALLPDSERERVSKNMLHYHKDFYQLLKDHSKAFEILRYSCELKGFMADLNFLISFAYTLRRVYDTLSEHNCFTKGIVK